MPQAQLSITLSTEMVDFVKTKVLSGEYADESDVIRDGLRRLQDRNSVFEDWLREEVVPAFDALQAHPERAFSVDQVRETLAAEHAKATQHG